MLHMLLYGVNDLCSGMKRRRSWRKQCGFEQTIRIIQTECLSVRYQDMHYSSPGLNIWGNPKGHFLFSFSLTLLSNEM